MAGSKVLRRPGELLTIAIEEIEMQAPTVAELLQNPIVQHAIDQAWSDSPSLKRSARQHEEGGWIYCDSTTGAIAIRRSTSGAKAELDLDFPPPVVGSVVVATFHTHPNPSADGWDSGPSPAGHEIGLDAWRSLSCPCGRWSPHHWPRFASRRSSRWTWISALRNGETK